MKNFFAFIIFLVLLISSGTLILAKVANSDFTSRLNESIKNISNTITSTYSNQEYSKEKLTLNQNNISTDNPSPKATLSPTKKPIPSLLPTITPKKNNSTPVACHRFTITHLDGSTSNLCYSEADYQQLEALARKLQSTKSNYNFENSVYEMYKKSNEESSTDFFEKPMKEAQKKAQSYQDQIGEISLQMYNIESRGY